MALRSETNSRNHLAVWKFQYVKHTKIIKRERRARSGGMLAETCVNLSRHASPQKVCESQFGRIL